MPKPARKRRNSDEGHGPVNKRTRPSPGDGENTFSEATKSSLLNPSSGAHNNHPVSVIESANSASQAAQTLTDAPTTKDQSLGDIFRQFTATNASPTRRHLVPTVSNSPADIFKYINSASQAARNLPDAPTIETLPIADIIRLCTVASQPPTIQLPAPTASNKPSGVEAGLDHPNSVHDSPPVIHPAISTPQRSRKRRQRATTPPETYTNNLPLVSIEPPIPERQETGWRRGRAYWLINGVTRITDPILETVDALLEAEERKRPANEAWNATLERAVQGVDWKDLLGEPPAHIREILRERAARERREGDGGNAEPAAQSDSLGGVKRSEEGKEGGHVDHDDGKAVGGGVGGHPYVDASCPTLVADLLIGMGDVAQHEEPGLVVEASPAEQAGEQSGEPEQGSGEDLGASGQASGEVAGEAEVVTPPAVVEELSLAPIVDPPRDLPGWVDYEARLVDPKYF